MRSASSRSKREASQSLPMLLDKDKYETWLSHPTEVVRLEECLLASGRIDMPRKSKHPAKAAGVLIA